MILLLGLALWVAVAPRVAAAQEMDPLLRIGTRTDPLMRMGYDPFSYRGLTRENQVASIIVGSKIISVVHDC